MLLYYKEKFQRNTFWERNDYSVMQYNIVRLLKYVDRSILVKKSIDILLNGLKWIKTLQNELIYIQTQSKILYYCKYYLYEHLNA